MLRSQELWNNDTGELICRSIANYGTGTEVFNEANYIAIPPCIWGRQAGALPVPVWQLQSASVP